MRWKLIWHFLAFALWWECCLCLRGSELVLQAKAKAAEEKLNPTTEEVVVGEDGNTTTIVKKPLLTGIPQKDYIHDPNLPRELKGHNLTNYPFYNSIPEDIEFACDGLHDGFYASVPHHCQVYHHCLYGTRYDFLCANYTAFDQKTFICHFVSEVDCENSPKYFVRNEALYKAASSPPPPTTTTATTTTTTTTTTRKPKRRRPGRRRRPIYEYYYDSEEYDDEYYDDEEEEPLPPPRKSGRKQRPNQGRDKMNRRRQQNSRKRPSRYEEDDYEEEDERPRMRKGNRKEDDYRRHRNKKGNYRDDDEDLPERPGRGGSRKRYPDESRLRGDRRSPPEYEYYDDEEEEKYERRRPTRKPDKRGRTTTKKYERTTVAADDEYEEYEDEEEDPKNKKKLDVTTSAPHRFSTLAYKSAKSTTTRPPAFRRPKPGGESERRYRPLSKRVESSTEEPTPFKRPIVMKPTVFPDRKFTSAVGAPAGFRKQEEKSTVEPSTEPYKEEEKTEAPRRPSESFRKQFSNFRRQQEDHSKDENSNRNSSPAREEVSFRPPFRNKESFNAQRNEALSSNNGRNPLTAEDDALDYGDPLSRGQEPPMAQSEESISSTRNSSRDRDENSNFRKFTSRGQDSRSEEFVPNNSRQKEETVQNGRFNPAKAQAAPNNNDGNSKYKENTSQNGRIFPSRSQESSSNEGGSSRYKEESPQNGRVYPSRSQESINNEGGSAHKEESIQNGRIYPSRSQETSSNEGGTSRFNEENSQNGRIYPSRSQEVSSNEGESSQFNEDSSQNGRFYPSRNQETSSNEGSSRSKEETSQNGRIYPSRSQETVSNEGGSSRYKQESPQNGRVYPSRNQEASSNDGGSSRFKEENSQNTRIYPSRSQETSNNEGGSFSRYKEENSASRKYPSRNQEASFSEENSSNNYRNSGSSEEKNYRSQSMRQESKQTENPTSNLRNTFSQEERVNNYRNPTAIADDVDYRIPSVSNEETNTNFRNQPSGSGNANYRNPHASSDESQYKSQEDRYRVPNINEAYHRPEGRWSPKDQAQYLSVEPSPPPPIEDVKSYLTGPDSEEIQDNKSSYPPAITSPPRGYRRYTKMKVAVRPKPVTEESVEYNKYPIPEESPKVDFTAPGPSAPQATPQPYLDIEEYDVTLNDALQPSTPYSRLKSRGYQPAVTHPSYRTGFLLTAASQSYPTKLASEYEAVVVPAQRFSTKRRPQEWYW